MGHESHTIKPNIQQTHRHTTTNKQHLSFHSFLCLHSRLSRVQYACFSSSSPLFDRLERRRIGSRSDPTHRERFTFTSSTSKHTRIDSIDTHTLINFTFHCQRSMIPSIFSISFSSNVDQLAHVLVITGDTVTEKKKKKQTSKERRTLMLTETDMTTSV